LRKKLGIDQRTEQRIADVALQAPQALGLRGRQAKTGHFDELALDSLKHIVYTHGNLRPSAGSSNRVRLIVLVNLYGATRVPALFRAGFGCVLMSKMADNRLVIKGLEEELAC
jgi:hypothetical protein